MENNRQILLSIIIPVYNAEKTLRECVDSVLIQAPNNSEIILINDGSTDASKAICNQYAEENAKIKVIHQDNKGISVTRNTGLKLACGDKIVFFDSDDYLEPDFLECILSHEADLVIGNYEAFYLDDHPNIRGDFRNLQYNSLHSFLNDFHIYYPVVTNVVWGKVYKKK